VLSSYFPTLPPIYPKKCIQQLCNPSVDWYLKVGSVVVPPADVVRDLSMLLDSELTMKPHVNKLVSTCFYHLRQLRQLKHYINRSVMQQLVASFILSRLDYCNSILVDLSWSTIAPLQRVQNVAARMVMGLPPRDHVTDPQQYIITKISRCISVMQLCVYIISFSEYSTHLLQVVQ